MPINPLRKADEACHRDVSTSSSSHEIYLYFSIVITIGSKNSAEAIARGPSDSLLVLDFCEPTTGSGGDEQADAWLGFVRHVRPTDCWSRVKCHRKFKVRATCMDESLGSSNPKHNS